MFGIPDYERYIEHMASRHPCDPLLSRREFFIWSIDRKYCRNGPRCC
ncbi:YbdD/YjiX family protein [Paraburkholderia graminis]